MMITDKQIKALKTEAIAHGDFAMAELCDRALVGDQDARAKCERVIAYAAGES